MTDERLTAISTKVHRRGVLATFVTGLLVAAVAVPVTSTTAGAVSENLIYGTVVESRTFEGYAQIPSEVSGGSPSTMVFVEDPGGNAAMCESISGVYDFGLLAGEYVETILEGYQHNPTRARATNPPGTYKTKAEFTTFPGGPRSMSECATTRSGVASATWGGYVSKEFSFQSASSDSTNAKVEGEDLVVAESLQKFHGVQLATGSIRTMESWVKAEFRPEVEPVVSYRIVLNGIFNGADEVAGHGGRGFVLSGQSVGGSEVAEQFNKEAAAHEEDMKAIGTYGFRILAPRYYQDPFTRRPMFEAPVLDASWGFAAREGGIGHNQGMRLGAARAGGRISYS